MSDVVLFCPDPMGLTLGPSAVPGECIKFKDGFARFDTDEFPDWESWVRHPGTPFIEVLPEDTAMVPAGTPNAFECPVCGRAFSHAGARAAHLKTHAPR